jgi:rare lipoprotein A
MYAMSAAHRTLPIPSYARVTSLDNGKSVVVRVNDRGPFHSKRIIDLSYTAAHKLGIIGSGSVRVVVESITPEDVAKKDTATGMSKDIATDAPGTYLQLGSFSNRSRAEKALADATAKLEHTDTPLLILAKNDRYRVALGPYADSDSADAAAREVQQRLKLKPIRVER